jgi:hypothetical protein
MGLIYDEQINLPSCAGGPIYQPAQICPRRPRVPPSTFLSVEMPPPKAIECAVRDLLCEFPVYRIDMSLKEFVRQAATNFLAKIAAPKASLQGAAKLMGRHSL